jgi:hypothetical protein
MRGLAGSIIVVVSLLLLFVGERVLGEGTARDVLVWLGGLGAVVAFGWRAMRFQAAKGSARQAEARLVVAYFGVLVGLGLYGLSTDWGLTLAGFEGDAADRTAGTLAALWPAVLAVSLTGLLFMELAYRKMPVTEAVELRRIQSAAYAGVSLALALVFVMSVNYVAEERDIKEDLSYFKTTKPSETSIRMVQKLGEPVKAVLFYPEVNEVVDQLVPYFRELDRASDKFEYEVKDHALAPSLAREHRIRKNGVVALLMGEGEEQQAEQFEVGTELEVARSRLRGLDSRFQKSFTRLTQARRELYLTTGHEERTSARGADARSPTDATTQLKSVLGQLNIQNRPLGISQGLANQVPEGAPAVAVVGPREEFLPEEAESLLRYVEDGGRLIVMVDPDVDHGLSPLLHGLGVEMAEGIVASEKNFVRRTRSPADHGIVYSSDFSAHPTVTQASRLGNQIAAVFLNAGTLRKHEGEDALPKAKVVFPIESGKDYWRDLDGDWERDKDEPLEKMSFMAAVSVPRDEGDDGRAVIIPDGHFVTDALIRNQGNLRVFLDILRWLIVEEQIVGEPTSEEDVRIEHTRDEDKAIFFGTSFGAPLPILGVGVWMAVRRKRRRETHRKDSGGDEGRGGKGRGGKGAGRPAAPSSEGAREEDVRGDAAADTEAKG